MVRVTIKSDKFDRIEFTFEDCEAAGKFLNVAMAAAVDKLKVEIETVEPAGEPQEESRFINPAELEEVPNEELASVEGYF